MDMLWIEWANSLHYAWRGGGAAKDELDSPAWPLSWANRHGLSVPGEPDGIELAALRRLRDLLREMASVCSRGEKPRDEALAELNAFMQESEYERLIERHGDEYVINTRPSGRDWHSVRSLIASNLAETLAGGDPGRICLCDNEDCRWVYYDDTRNRSKRYCEDKTCGNLLKVRRFRARKKAERPAGRNDRGAAD